ncbi:unnamed protein product [Mytilus coruscus]|uniref:Uncharacterized protein n=1 Tax=Mytilus coruscus TaxID=42192 RepID=A0A6J8BX71_MYTCO|nr:unnamed protein product [Mytilus coruscus]
MAEGTKICRPDEFDFILCLDKLNDVTDIVMTDNLLETGFASLKFKTNQVFDEYLQFTDADGYFLAYFVSEQLRISIDLVPVVYKRGWWPINTDIDKIPLVSPDIKAAGCFLTLQTKALKILLHDNDCISQTCNTEDPEEEQANKRLLRISAAPAEIFLMKSLPDDFRQAYVLAKVLKKKVVDFVECTAKTSDIFIAESDIEILLLDDFQAEDGVIVISEDSYHACMIKVYIGSDMNDVRGGDGFEEESVTRVARLPTRGKRKRKPQSDTYFMFVLLI